MAGKKPNRGRSALPLWIGGSSFLLLGAVVWLGGLLAPGAGRGPAAAATPSAAADQPLTRSAPPASCGHCAANLVGKTAAEIGQYALQWSISNDVSYVRTGTPQVLLSRGITGHELPRLGIGCLSPSTTVEEPPYALVILKGYFSSRRAAAQLAPPFRYLAVVIDLWAAMPIRWNGSQTGAAFRTALNDPSLPVAPHQSAVTTCPPDVLARFADGSPVHYGDSVPKGTAPPRPSGVVSVATSTPRPLPPPNATQTGALPLLPQPIPTHGAVTK